MSSDHPTEHAYHNRGQDKTKTSNPVQHTAGLYGSLYGGGHDAASVYRQRYFYSVQEKNHLCIALFIKLFTDSIQQLAAFVW